MTTQIGLFQALIAKMDYLNQRQNIISQNIANSDTPDYMPQDLEPVDFGEILGKEQGRSRVGLNTTDEAHMMGSNSLDATRSGNQDHTYEVAPSGNSVILEEQLINANRNSLDYSMITNLYQANLAMFYTAIGTG